MAGMTHPGGIGILADDAAIRLDGHEDKVHRGIFKNGAVAFARTAQFVHQFAQRARAIRDLAFQHVGEAAERTLGLDAPADVAPVDRDAVAGRTHVDRHPDAGGRRRRLEGYHALFLANAPEHLLVQGADELREALPDDPAPDVAGGHTPECQCPSIGVDDAPRAIEGIERVAHAFQDGLGVG